LVLDVLLDKHLSSIVRDNCLLFHPRAGSPEDDISLIRAKEKVQAAFAETRRRLDLEEVARKATKEGAMVAVDLDMGTSTTAAPEDISALTCCGFRGTGRAYGNEC
jgi:transposase